MTAGIPFEVAKKTGGLSNGDVGTLNDLRMARGAAELLAEPHLQEVRSMVKDDPLLKENSALKESSVMTAGTQARLI